MEKSYFIFCLFRVFCDAFLQEVCAVGSLLDPCEVRLTYMLSRFTAVIKSPTIHMFTVMACID